MFDSVATNLDLSNGKVVFQIVAERGDIIVKNNGVALELNFGLSCNDFLVEKLDDNTILEIALRSAD